MLTELQIRKFNHSGRSHRADQIKDIANLYLLVQVGGTKSWVYRYTFNGRAKKMGLGSYPLVSLKDARLKVQEYNKLRLNGEEPSLKKTKEVNQDLKLFSNVCSEWFKSKEKELAPSTFKKLNIYLKNDIYPVLKNRYIDDIEYIEIVNFLKKFKSTPNKQSKIKSILSGIYKLAKANGLCKNNPINGDLSIIIIMEKQKNNNYPFIHPVDDRDNLSMLLNAIDSYDGSYLVKKALQIAPYLAFRPNMIVSLKWSDFQEKEKNLIIRAENMKMSKEFKQPLSIQAYNILLELREYTGTSDYIFSNRKGGHITPDSLGVAIKDKLGFDGRRDKPRFTTHGWRHVTSTGMYHLQAKYKWQGEAIEMVLDHQERNNVKAAYNNYDYLEERRAILSIWSNYIDDIKENGNVISMEKVA